MCIHCYLKLSRSTKLRRKRRLFGTSNVVVTTFTPRSSLGLLVWSENMLSTAVIYDSLVAIPSYLVLRCAMSWYDKSWIICINTQIRWWFLAPWLTLTPHLYTILLKPHPKEVTVAASYYDSCLASSNYSLVLNEFVFRATATSRSRHRSSPNCF